MRRKTQIVLAITFMVAALVCGFSYIYVSQILRQRIAYAHDTAASLESQIAYIAAKAVIPDFADTRVDTNNPAKVRRAITDYLATNLDLNTILESVVDWPMIYDAAILDVDGKAILHTNAEVINKTVLPRPDFQIVQDAKFRRQLRLIYHPPTLYDVSMPLKLNGQDFGSIRLGVSTVFLKNEITPRLEHAVIFSGISILLSLMLAAGLSHIALGPLERINRSSR